jgi:hypothetical protein
VSLFWASRFIVSSLFVDFLTVVFLNCCSVLESAYTYLIVLCRSEKMTTVQVAGPKEPSDDSEEGRHDLKSPIETTEGEPACPRESLRQKLYSRRTSLRDTEALFLEHLLREGDDEHVVLAGERLNDDKLFFDHEADPPKPQPGRPVLHRPGSRNGKESLNYSHRTVQ